MGPPMFGSSALPLLTGVLDIVAFVVEFAGWSLLLCPMSEGGPDDRDAGDVIMSGVATAFLNLVLHPVERFDNFVQQVAAFHGSCDERRVTDGEARSRYAHTG
jgi:hypothetical protein